MRIVVLKNKGPHSLGGKNSNNIGIKYRDLHPSMLGEIDVLVCGNSDPGTSGLLSPFAKIDGLYFDQSDEVDNFYYDLMKDISKKYENKHVKFIQCKFDNSHDFYKALYDMEKITHDDVTVYGTSREGQYELVVNEEGDMDDQTKPQTVSLRKKKNDPVEVVTNITKLRGDIK